MNKIIATRIKMSKHNLQIILQKKSSTKTVYSLKRQTKNITERHLFWIPVTRHTW